MTTASLVAGISGPAPSCSSTPSRGVVDPFMGPDVGDDDPFASCVLTSAAAARGVTTNPVPEATRSAPTMPTQTTTTRNEESESGTSDEETHSQRSRGLVSRATTPVASASVVPRREQPPAAVAATPGRSYSYPLSDEEMVNYLTTNPQDDGQRYVVDLYHQGYVPADSVANIVAEFRRIKRILSSYAANLVIRRAQVQDRPDLGNPDGFLREQLYLQTGQKLP